MELKDRLVSICRQRLKKLGLTNKEYIDRLKYELIEIDVQEKHAYFLEHHDAGTKWAKNDHNLLVPYLLGLCPECHIEQEPASIMGEYPDIDLDMIEPIRDHIRLKWAPEKFGHDKVAFISTYSTYNLKGALLDMARIFDLPHQEIQAITKQFAAKDDDGDDLKWDAAEKMYPAFREWVKNNPEAAEAARKLHGRNRNMGQHAGGFIISSVALDGFVPMVRNSKDGSMMTAWTEGQTAQDLMWVGLVKFDTLGSKMQEQIVECVGMILERHNMDNFCAKEEGPIWSDDHYLNDPQAMKMADKGDLRFIFQFDSDGIRRLVRTGGVDSFKDLEAYSALYRPGVLNAGMHEVYCRRKRGEESYDIHPALKRYLDSTYGIMTYQEQVMYVLNAVGKILLRDAYDVVKAISKKKIEKFEKHKALFIANAQQTLSITEEEAVDMWNNIEEFAGYGFNKAHSCVYTHQSSRQLYLKCHYPLEYFCSMLNHIRGDDKKMRDCVRQAESHNVKVNPLSVNHSKIDFTISGDEIYMGFSNVKFVGHDAAERVVALRDERPFDGFKDFLDRFGTEAKVVHSLVALRAFDEADPVTLWKYYEAYKKQHKSVEGRQKRFKAAMAKYRLQYSELTGFSSDAMDEESLTAAADVAEDEAIAKSLRKLLGNYRRSKTNYELKESEQQDMVSVSEFDADASNIEIKKDVLDTLEDQEKAELHLYGFCWSHPLDKCPDSLRHLTFERYKANVEQGKTGFVEGLVLDNKETTSRKGTKYRTMRLMDRNWEVGYVNVWAEEHERFKDMLTQSSIVRIELSPPNPKYNGARYALKSYPKWERTKVPSLVSDIRVIPLSIPVDDDESPVSLDDNESQVTLDIKQRVDADIRRDNDRDRDYTSREVATYFGQ